MSDSPPLLSFVIPTRNRFVLVQQALKSASQQFSFPVEVILSDNASTDPTPSLAQSFPTAKYLRRTELLPMADHWNKAVQEAKGKYIKLLCDDDWVEVKGVEAEIRLLESDPSLAAAASSRNEVSPDGTKVLATQKSFSEETRLEGQALFFEMLRRENIVGPPSAVTFRKSSFQRFPSHYHYAADWASWILLAEKGGIGFVPDIGCNFRLHESNLTLKHVESDQDFLEVQALRKECLKRLHFPWNVIGAVTYAWIWNYRFARRIARYASNGRMLEVPRLLRKAITFAPKPLA